MVALLYFVVECYVLEIKVSNFENIDKNWKKLPKIGLPVFGILSSSLILKTLLK